MTSIGGTMKKLVFISFLAAAFFSPLFAQAVDPCSQSTKLSQTASGVVTYSSNSNGNQTLGGSGDLTWGYEMWTEGGNNNKLIWFGPNQGGGMAFRAEWNNPNDYLGRVGFFWGKGGKKWDQYREIYADFNYTRSGNGTGGGYSYIGIYGWTWDPMMEWYIIDDWFGSEQLGPNTFCNGNCQPVGTFEMDGGTYNVYTFTRPEGSGSIYGNGQTPAFPQIFSIRQNMNSGGRRSCGTYSITEHFRKWSEINSINNHIGTHLYEAKFLAEAGAGTGWFELSYLKMTLEDAPRSIPANHYVVVTDVSPFNGGTVSKNPPLLYYESGATVELTANPANGWKFDRWEGDASGTNATTNITVDAKKNVTAKFSLSADNNINLVRDGDFPGSSLTSNWSMNKGQYYGNSEANASVSSGKVKVDISNATTNAWEPQLTQYDIELVQGMRYILTYTAQAASARTIEVSIQKAVDPWNDYARDTVDLTAAPQTFTLEFEMKDPTDPASQLSFNLGGKQGNMPSVTISDVSLKYVVIDEPSSSSAGASSSSSSRASSSSSSGTSSSSSGGSSSSSSSDDGSPIRLISNISKTEFSVSSLSGKFLLVETSSPRVVEIYDLKGNKAMAFNALSGLQTVNLSLPYGVYFAKAQGMQTVRFVLK